MATIPGNFERTHQERISLALRATYDCLDHELEAIIATYGGVKNMIQTSESMTAEKEKPAYLLGQRVLLNRFEIGTIVNPERTGMPNTDTYVWVYSPKNLCAAYYSVGSIKPLPNGQL